MVYVGIDYNIGTGDKYCPINFLKNVHNKNVLQ